MKLVVGLGNPGLLYAKNRHNVGFQSLDFLAKKHGLIFDKKSMNALWTKSVIAGQEVILAKPQTFMNLSGKSVAEISRFYKIEPGSDLLVVLDDLDLPVGKLRIRPEGRSGGQNGLKSIIELLGTEGVQRLRVGIGRPAFGNPRDYVLNNFDRDQAPVIQDVYPRVATAVEVWLAEGILKAMNLFNS